MKDKLKDIANRLEIITEAFDTKNKVHNKLNMDYIKIRDEHRKMKKLLTNMQAFYGCHEVYTKDIGTGDEYKVGCQDITELLEVIDKK